MRELPDGIMKTYRLQKVFKTSKDSRSVSRACVDFRKPEHPTEISRQQLLRFPLSKANSLPSEKPFRRKTLQQTLIRAEDIATPD